MNTNNIGRILVSAVVVIGFVAVTVLFVTTKYNGGAPGETLSILLGALATNFTAVVGYWIGSSSGSTAKDEKLSELVGKPQPEPPKP